MSDKIEMKTLILDAAIQEFAEKGFANTTMADIAKKAGIAVGSIYNYSKNKVALFETCTTFLLEEFRTFIHPILNNTENRIYNMIKKSFEYLKQDLARAKILLVESYNFMINAPDSPISDELLAFEEALKSILKEDIFIGKKAHQDIQISLLLGGVERMIKDLIFFPQKSKFDAEAAARSIADMLSAYQGDKECH